MNYREIAKRRRAIEEVRIIEREIIVYEMDRDAFPASLAEIGLDTWLDPWKNPYQYLNHDTLKKDKKGKIIAGQGVRKDHSTVPVNTDFDLYSMGRDGKSKGPFTAQESQDDIVRANNGQFIGLVVRY